MVSIVRESSDPYRWSLGTAPLAEVALGAKPMPDEYINADGNFVTPACIEYLKPLVGPLPEYVRLAGSDVACTGACPPWRYRRACPPVPRYFCNASDIRAGPRRRRR